MSIVVRIHQTFERLEQWDLRVGTVWLNPKQILELAADRSGAWDPIWDRHVRDIYIPQRGAPLAGMLFGANVHASPIVPENHIGVIPAGFDGRITGPEGCMPLPVEANVAEEDEEEEIP
jgi:hypothetical protein